MAHSTTTTASHILTKYSKCYVPAHSSTQSSQTDGAGEWQHFVNPVLELVLDIKKSRLNNELESVRLRILWNMDTSGIKNEVLFEDLDLLAYSDIPTSGQPIPGLPLKAVYRDAVVGIRYLYPIIATPDAQPVLRPTSASASRFSRVFLVYDRLFVDFKSLLPRPTQHSSSSMRYATSAPAKSIHYPLTRTPRPQPVRDRFRYQDSRSLALPRVVELGLEFQLPSGLCRHRMPLKAHG
ncbi:hypothetical protein EYR40_004259 [Pleurotus pulmonarius]|nr:hypothetical protein EYR36_007170 [Pleurotus pulmonarius]KAF4605475.1 hypothetical protein EYR40_004259 [Pleurotus pulmonarius]KAF4606964.1 hypothetical protein EYR38_001019 [Pleurotus pulmonarius]